MSKFSKAFGAKYDKDRLSILTRTFQLGEHTFKVRVPSVGELERIYNYSKNPNQELVEKTYQAMIYQEGLNDEGQKVILVDFRKEEKDGDVVIEGRSLKEAAANKVVLQYRITEYFKFLIPETEETLEDLEYADIEAEFPLAIQLQFIDKINEVISPEYKEARGKS